MTSFVQESFLKRSQGWCEQNNIPSTPKHLERVREFTKQIPPDTFFKLLKEGHALITEKLTFDQLIDQEKVRAEKAGFHVQAAVGRIMPWRPCFYPLESSYIAPPPVPREMKIPNCLKC